VTINRTGLTISVSGANNSFDGSTTFSVSPSDNGTSVGSPVILGADSATFLLNSGSVARTLTISNNTNPATATITVNPEPTMNVSPTEVSAGDVNTTITVTGTYNGFDGSTTFTATPANNGTLADTPNVTGANAATFLLDAGSLGRVLTISNSTNTATATISVNNVLAPNSNLIYRSISN
jgi:hypothetical protein